MMIDPFVRQLSAITPDRNRSRNQEIRHPIAEIAEESV